MNSFGQSFRISIYGESHGEGVGVLIDGCPPGIELDVSDFKEQLERRRSGAKGTTPRCETDIPHLASGVYQGRTTGAPILIQFKNNDTRPGDYEDVSNLPRPGHADLTAKQKYRGFNDPRGGGHFSGRLTVALVAAGVVARKIIDPINITAFLAEAGGLKDIEAAVEKAIVEEESIGGIIECEALHMPSCLGEPFFNSVESLISHLIFSIPGVRAIEFGSGFHSAGMVGSQHNDSIVNSQGKTETNNAGGVNGGISNGNNLKFRVCIKPTATIGKPQKTVDMITGEQVELSSSGRHDTCIALRCPVIIESAVAIVLADLFQTKSI